MQDSTNSILKSAKRFLSGTSLSRVSGFFRDIAMAAFFGTEASVAAFFVAFRLSHFFRRILGEGALQTAFIPQFEALRKESPLRAVHFFRDLSALLTLLLLFLVVISLGLLMGYLHWGGLTVANQEIVKLTLYMMPSLTFICLYGLNASFLQCEKSYFTASIAPVAFNAIWLLGVFSLWKKVPEEAMPWLCLFIILACLAQWAVTLPLTLRYLRSYGLLNPLKGIHLFSKDLKDLFKPFLLAIFGVSAAQINNALDALFARYADPEGPALLWYAIRLQQLPLALFGIAISGALLPPLSRAIKRGDFASFRRFLEFSLRKSFLLMLPLTVAILLLGDQAVQFVYGRGQFSLESSVGTSLCLWAYGLGLIPMALVLILGPAFYAQGDFRTPTIASFLTVLLNLLLNALFVMQFELGAISIALATSLSSWVNLAYLTMKLKKSSGPFSFWQGILKIALATAVATVFLLTIEGLFFENSALQILKGISPSYPPFLSITYHLVIQGFVFFAGFFLTTFLLQEPLWQEQIDNYQ